MTAKQLDRLLSIIDRAVKVAERWADREYPVIDEKAKGFISRVGDRHKKPQSPEEYETFEPETEPEVGRFEAHYRSQT